MLKNEARKLALQTYLEEVGLIANNELAKRLSVHAATIARWKRTDNWQEELEQFRQNNERPTEDLNTDITDFKEISRRLSALAKDTDLNASSIYYLAKAKCWMMKCRELILDEHTQE
jgi:uncharacterized protein YjcR